MSVLRFSEKVSIRNRRPPRSSDTQRCWQKFLRFFPNGFADPKFDAWERGYKWKAHENWMESLNKDEFSALLRAHKYSEIAARAVRIESRTNLLFSFEKMALRDAVKSPAGAKLFATGLFEFLYGPGSPKEKFNRWTAVVSELPRRQTRVLTWPVVTVFGFIARPDLHIFLKPNVTQRAAAEYGFEFTYASRPTWPVYQNLLKFARTVRQDLADAHPRNLIDIQSFLWVLGSDEYAD